MTFKLPDTGLSIVFLGSGKAIGVTDVGSCISHALFVIIEVLLDNKAKNLKGKHDTPNSVNKDA